VCLVFGVCVCVVCVWCVCVCVCVCVYVEISEKFEVVCCGHGEGLFLLLNDCQKMTKRYCFYDVIFITCLSECQY